MCQRRSGSKLAPVHGVLEAHAAESFPDLTVVFIREYQWAGQMEIESILTNARKLYNARNKCKELRFSFASVSHDLPSIVIGGECIKIVTDAELLAQNSSISGDYLRTRILQT